MPDGALYQVTCNQVLNSEPLMDVFYYLQASDTSSGEDEKLIAQQFISNVIPSWKAAVATSVQLACLNVQRMKWGTHLLGPSLDYFIDDFGARAGEALPATIAGLIQKKNTVVTGKGKQGRVYVAGLIEDDADQGRINPAAQALLDTLRAALMSQLAAEGATWDPYWATWTKVPPIEISAITAWNIGTVMPRLANQRRRRTPVRAFLP